MVSMCSALSRTVRGSFCSGGLQARVRHISVSIPTPARCEVREIKAPGFERVVHFFNNSGLNGAISIHNSTLGEYRDPEGKKRSISVGGIRIRGDYTSELHMIKEAQNLSVGMTEKSAIGGSKFGGAKCCVWMDPRKMNRENLHSLGEVIDSLEGAYVGAEDVNSTTEMMDTIAEKTRYVTGLSHPKSSGDPSPFTAYGVMRAMKGTCQFLHGSDSLEGKTVAIQGAVGNVGSRLVELLFWEGAQLIVTDLNLQKCAALAKKTNALLCEPKEIFNQKCDIFAPCAYGGVLNQQTISVLRCKMVVGAANNQLLEVADADRLKDRNIIHTYEPVANPGGILNITQELEPEGYQSTAVRNKVHTVYDTTLEMLILAQASNKNTRETSVELAYDRIRKGIGKRTVAPCFHHYEAMKVYTETI